MARAETYRCEYVRCGKKGCKRCPHGPYWYGYWREGKRTRKRYYGRFRPGDSYPSKDPDPGKRLDDIFHKDRATAALAKEILGIVHAADHASVRKAYREISMASHPDRGGDNVTFARASAAYSYLCNLYGWA